MLKKQLVFKSEKKPFVFIEKKFHFSKLKNAQFFCII